MNFSIVDLCARFVATFLIVFILLGVNSFFIYLSYTYIKDEFWQSYADLLIGITLLLFAVQLVMKL